MNTWTTFHCSKDPMNCGAILNPSEVRACTRKQASSTLAQKKAVCLQDSGKHHKDTGFGSRHSEKIVYATLAIVFAVQKGFRRLEPMSGYLKVEDCVREQATRAIDRGARFSRMKSFNHGQRRMTKSSCERIARRTRQLSL